MGGPGATPADRAGLNRGDTHHSQDRHVTRSPALTALAAWCFMTVRCDEAIRSLFIFARLLSVPPPILFATFITR